MIAFDMFMALVLVIQGKTLQPKPQGGGLGGELELFFLFASVAVFFLGSGRLAVSKGQGRWD